MATDIYTLGISVDSTDVKESDKALDNLAKSAELASGSTKKMTDEALKAARAQKENSKETKKGATALVNLNKKLDRQVALIGKTREEILIYDARQAGATEEDIKAIQAKSALITKINAQGQATKIVGLETKAMAASTAAARGAIGGLGRNAGMAGIQIQQFVGQVQGGQSAMVALSQQSADLGFVLGAPMLGVIVSLGAVLAGVLLPSLMGAKDEAKEARIEFDFLSDSFSELTEQQRVFAAFSLQDQLLESKTRSSELRAEIDTLTNTLSISSATLTQYIDEGRISAEQAEESSKYYIEQAKRLAELNFQYDDEARALALITERLAILNGQKEETTKNSGKTPWWGGDEAVEQQAFDIRMQLFQDEQLAIDLARKENLEGYQSILQMQFQSAMSYNELELEAEREHLGAMANEYGLYADSRAQSDIEANQRAVESAIQSEKDKNKAKADLASAFTTFMDSENRALFEIGKIGAAGNALIAADEAAARALTLGPIAGPIAAGIMYTAGVSRAASIMGRSFGDTGSRNQSVPDIPAAVQQTTTQSVSNTFNIQGGNADSIASQIQELFDSGAMGIKNGSIVSV